MACGSDTKTPPLVAFQNNVVSLHCWAKPASKSCERGCKFVSQHDCYRGQHKTVSYQLPEPCERA
jgi:hypothetical protein